MFKPNDTRRAHSLARSIAPACSSYREAYAIGAAHVAASNRTTVTPTRHPLTAWAFAALLTVAAWMACPAVAAAAN